MTGKKHNEVYEKHCNRFFDNPNESCIVFCPLDPPYQVELHRGGRGFRNSTFSRLGAAARPEQNLDPEEDYGHFEFTDSFYCNYESLSDDWKVGAVLWAVEHRKTSSVDVQISATSSVFEFSETMRGLVSEGYLFVVGFVLVWLFCGMAMHFINFENHSLCNATNWFTATICIASAMLAVLSAIGLCGYLTIQGLKLTPSSLYVSFMILGHAVDDMMILAGLFFEVPKDHSLAERLAASFGSSATSITLTSITTLAGFLAGSAIDMVWISSFAQVGALAVVADYIIQLTFFSGAFAAFQRSCSKLETSTKDRGHAHSALETYARWSAHSAACKGVTLLVFIVLVFVALYGTQNLDAAFHNKVNVPDDSHYQTFLQDGLHYMGEYGTGPVYLVMKHEVLPGPDVMRATAEYAQRIRELNGQKPYKATSADWTVAMQLWMAIESHAERLRVRTNTTAFGVAIQQVLDGTLRDQYGGLAKQWQNVGVAYAASGLAVQAALAEVHGMAQDLHQGPHQVLESINAALHEVQVALNATRHAYGNFTQELGLGLQTALTAGLAHLHAAADAYDAGAAGSAESLLQQAEAALNLSSFSAPGISIGISLNSSLNSSIGYLEEVATQLLDSVYAFNASLEARTQHAAASLRVAAASCYQALPSDDRLLAKYFIQFGQREFLRRLGDLMGYMADPVVEVVVRQWWNTTLFPMEVVGVHARNTAATLRAMQQAAETFTSEPLAPVAAACAELRNLLAASPDAAFNSRAVRALGDLVASAAAYAGDETSLAHVEQHYEDGAYRDPGADDVCSPEEVTLETLRRGLAHGVAHYRSTVIWNAFSNYSMAGAQRWLTSIVGRSVNLHTPQAVSATRRFGGYQWLSLAGERDQVARERDAERKADQADRAVAAARRMRLAREATAEVWEAVDNFEESFGTEMEGVVYDEDLKPGGVGVGVEVGVEVGGEAWKGSYQSYPKSCK